MLTNEQKEQFEERGYIVAEGVLQGELLAQMRAEASRMGRDEPERQGWNERPCFRRAPFRRLLDIPALIDIVRELVGADVQLLALDLLRVPARGGGTDWHRDVEFVFERTIAVSCALYLQDTAVNAGSLRVVPDSHGWMCAPPEPGATPLDGEVTLQVSAGAAVIHDSGLWHTASANEAPTDCWGLFPIFGPYWIKRRDSGFASSLPADLLKTSDPLKRQLLGLGLRAGITSFLGDDDQYARRGDPGIDYPSGSY